MIALAFIALLVSVIEIGRFFLMWNGFQYAVENANRVAMVDSILDEDDVAELVTERLDTFLMSADNATITVSFTSSSGGLSFTEIEGTYDYEIIVPFVPASWNTVSLSAKSRLAMSEQ